VSATTLLLLLLLLLLLPLLLDAIVTVGSFAGISRGGMHGHAAVL